MMIAILYNIRSLHNVGSIFRTADAAGIEKIYLCGITPEPVDIFGRPRPQLTKVALGAEKSVPWDASATATAGQARSAQGTLKLIERLKRDGYKIFAIEQSKKSTPYNRITLRQAQGRIALVLGNEVRGLPSAILKKADKILEIPMRGAMVRQAHHPRQTGRGKESLNVAVAFGIVVFRILEDAAMPH